MNLSQKYLLDNHLADLVISKPGEPYLYVSDAIIEFTAEQVWPVLDILEDKISAGAEIKKQDNEWNLFKESGELIISGRSIREMLVNLVFTEC